MVFIVEAFFSGCISKIINDGKDYSWAKIKREINDRNNRNLSTKIYRVIENTLNIVTDKKFQGQDILYEAIEKIFIEFRDNGSTIESVKVGLEVLNSNVNIERCENFLEKFNEGICQDDNLYREINMILQQKGLHINQGEFQKINESVEYGFNQLNRKIDNLADGIIENSLVDEKNETRKNLKFSNNKKQLYIKNWNSRLFLHLDNDENPITLAYAFIMPDYKIHKFTKKICPHSDVSLDKVIQAFVEYNDTSTLLITGVPGIGKSSITAWVAQKYEMYDNFIILRFRDWELEELEEGLIKAICSTLECKKRDLNNKVILIDGFDEVKSLDRRDFLLYGFLNEINDFENLKIVITSRSSYIDWSSFYNVIELNPFGINKIKKYYKLINGIELSENNIDIDNLDVLGIPVILYMAIMSNIDITKNTTKPQLYNRIFAEKGGIFDKFYDGETEYDGGAQILRNMKNIKDYLEFLRKIAFIMFEKNNLSLKIMECEIPKLKSGKDYVSILEFPIKHLFENTSPNIEFIHKSIYEYFVAEYIFNSIRQAANSSMECFAEVLGNLLRKNNLSYEVLEFLKYKIINDKLNDKFDFVNKTFQLMIKNGMTFYTKKCFNNVIDCEMNVFSNILELMHLWDNWFLKFDGTIYNYLKYNKHKYLNLEGAVFDFKKIVTENGKLKITKRMCLEGIYLEKAKLTGANLSATDLQGVVLKEANLEGADLRRVNLKDADLRNANLNGADLRDANLFNTDLRGTKLCNTNLRNVDLSDTELRNADLFGADLKNANLIDMNLEGIELSKANLENADLQGANLAKANLGNANLKNANLQKTCLCGANLKNADLENANLLDTNLEDADLLNANLLGVNIKKINMKGANLT